MARNILRKLCYLFQKSGLDKDRILKERYNSDGLGWVLITGGSMGIGRAFSETFAKLGFNVFIVSNDDQANMDTRKFIQEESPKVHTDSLFMNFSDENFKSRLEKIPDLDFRILINCAGVPARKVPPKNTEDYHENEKLYDYELMEYEDLRACYQINCIALTIFTKFFLERAKHLTQQDRENHLQQQQQQPYLGYNNFQTRANNYPNGDNTQQQVLSKFEIQPRAIISMSSMQSKTFTYHIGIYGSGKYYINHLMQYLKQELKQQNVQVISATPGLVRTRLTGYGSTFFYIDPDECVKGIIEDLALKKGHSFSHWKHWLFFTIHKLLSIFGQQYADYFMMSDILKPKRDRFDYAQ